MLVGSTSKAAVTGLGLESQSSGKNTPDMQLPCLPLVSTNKTPFPISSHECLKMPAFSSDSSDIYLRTAASGDPTPINASSLLHPNAISPSVCHHPSIPTISPRPRRHPPHTNLRSAVCAAPGSDRMDSSHSSHGAGRQEQQSIFQFHNGARRRWGVGGEGAGKTTNGMSADKMRRQEGRREKRKGGETEHFSSLKTSGALRPQPTFKTLKVVITGSGKD